MTLQVRDSGISGEGLGVSKAGVRKSVSWHWSSEGVGVAFLLKLGGSLVELLITKATVFTFVCSKNVR